MAVNAEHQQVAAAGALEEAARILAHSTRDVPNPINSYRLLSELGLTVDHLQQVSRQLAARHRCVVDFREYRGEDENSDGVTGTLAAAEQPDAAASALEQARDALSAAHSAIGVVRWMVE